MPTYYADNYEEITGKTREPDVEVVAKVIIGPEVAAPAVSPVEVATEATPVVDPSLPAPPQV